MASTIQIAPADASKIIQATTVSIFNEQEASTRRELMEKHWSKDIVCFSPFGAAEGFDAIDQLWQGKRPPPSKEIVAD